MGERAGRTLYDVARAAGVSTATVSRVVHSQAGVRSSTRQHVLGVIEELGYVPDGAAQSMAMHRTEVVGLVSIESRGPETEIEQEGLLFIEEVLRGVETALRPLGWSVLISVLREADRPDAYRRLQRVSAKVDGMLISEGIISSDQLALLTARIPVVLVAGSAAQPHADVACVDNRSGAMALARHLLERHGRRRMFYVTGPSEAPDAQERRRAFEDAVAQQPGATLVGCFEGRFAAVSGQHAVREILARPRQELPDAIVCGNDLMAIGAMRELQAAGIRVPADIAVAGFDDIHLGAMLTPPLTTVRQSMRLLGERACSLLLERIADPAMARRVERLPTELIVRESCGCPPRVTAGFLPGGSYRELKECLSGGFPGQVGGHERTVRLDGEVEVPRRHVPNQEAQAVATQITHHAEQRDQPVGMLRGDLLGGIHAF
jgi:LacI family transcriptional regulator